MVNVIPIPDGSINWGAIMRANLDALNTGISIAETKASAAVNMASTRVRSVNGTFPDESGNVALTISSADQTARDAAAAAQSTADSKYTKPTSGIPATDLASAVQTSLSKADSAYVKPNNGIPASDLTSAAQTSLGKADTAYQKPSGGIPDTDLVSKFVKTVNGNAPDTYGNVAITVEGGGYVKPSGGIPSSDMTTAVQTSLGKADSASQPGHTHPVSQISDSTTIGQSLVTAADQQTARSAIGALSSARLVSTGTGLTGGGALTTDRTIALNSTSIASLAKADTAVQPSDSTVAIGAWTAWNPAGYTSTAQYRLTPDSVQWRGQLTLTSGNQPANTNNTIGTLPTAARPLDFLRLAWWMYGTVFAGLQINTTGVMTLTTGASAGDTIYLSGLNYAR